MLDLLESLSPLPRLVNSQGLDQAFAFLTEQFPDLLIQEYESGKEFEDWTVPHAWEVLQGVLEDEAGNVIASIQESPLFVAPYSEPVDGLFSKQEILPHLRMRPDRPEAFALEHRNAYDYRLKDWGITLPHTRWQALPEGRYRVHIETRTWANSMKTATWFLPGRRNDTLCMNAHIDELCNDDLSGCVVGLEMMRALAGRRERQFSYLLLLSPEMFGTLAYVYEHPAFVKNCIGMLNLEALGAGENLCLKRSFAGPGRLEALMRSTLDSMKIDFKELDFFEGYGNDERVLEWPTLGVPGIALQRYPFAQYHTSEDTPAIIDAGLLEQAVEICDVFAETLERERVPRLTGTLQPWLTKRGLYFDSSENEDALRKLNNIVLFSINGRRSIQDLADLAEFDFQIVADYLDKFVDEGLIDYSDVEAKAFARPNVDRRCGSCITGP